MSLAFVFPGQGSQSIGMLNSLAEAYSQVKDTYAQASDVLGYDLFAIVNNGPAEKLNSTDVTQPAMLTAGVATWGIWNDKGGQQPKIMAGHSLGEYSALVCAGAIEFVDAIKLVSSRGQYMQEAVPAGTGAMAAVLGLDDDAVRAVCVEAAAGDIVEAVNFNSKGQVVVAGSKEAVERATVIAKDKGAKRAVILPVSVPSHCQLMKPAADKLAKDLKQIKIKQPSIEIINNVDVKIESNPDAIRDALVRQLYQPVRWVEIIQAMAGKNIKSIIECGPGKILTGLNKRIDKSILHAAIVDADSMNKALEDQQ